MAIRTLCPHCGAKGKYVAMRVHTHPLTPSLKTKELFEEATPDTTAVTYKCSECDVATPKAAIKMEYYFEPRYVHRAYVDFKGALPRETRYFCTDEGMLSDPKETDMLIGEIKKRVIDDAFGSIELDDIKDVQLFPGGYRNTIHANINLIVKFFKMLQEQDERGSVWFMQKHGHNTVTFVREGKYSTHPFVTDKHRHTNIIGLLHDAEILYSSDCLGGLIYKEDDIETTEDTTVICKINRENFNSIMKGLLHGLKSMFGERYKCFDITEPIDELTAMGTPHIALFDLMKERYYYLDLATREIISYKSASTE